MSQPLQGSIAKVYLLREGDEQNVCYVNNEQLLVIRKNISTRINLDLIQSITFSSKKFLFPLVAGGILLPFFFIALFEQLLHPYITLGGFLISTYLFYIGYTGSPGMMINGHQTIKEYFLPSISPNLRAFAEFVNKQLLAARADASMYQYVIWVTETQKHDLAEGATCSFNDGIELHPLKEATKYNAGQELAPLIVDIKHLTEKVSYENRGHSLLKLVYNGDISKKEVISGL